MSQNTSENALLAKAAERLGLSDETGVFNKAQEFLRIYQLKGAVISLNDNAKAVLCLDLASSMLGVGFDKETALKLSGLKKSTYQNNLNVVEKVLELDKPLTIGEVCVQYSCTEVKELAERILEAYKTQGLVTDFQHPQYVAVSVYIACKLKHFKVQKSQFVTASRLKPIQWKGLETTFDKFVDKAGIATETKKKKGNKNEMHAYLEEYAKTNEIKASPKQRKAIDEVEEYEIWRERILTTAKEALKDRMTEMETA